MSISAITKNVEELVPVVLARAGYEKRRIETAGSDQQEYSPVLSVLMEGIKKVRQGETLRVEICTGISSMNVLAAQQGDPRLRLEKFFSSMVGVLNCHSALGVQTCL